MKVYITVIVLLLFAGCSTSTPALNANSNKIEVFSLSRFINVTNVTYVDSLKSTNGAVTQIKE